MCRPKEFMRLVKGALDRKSISKCEDLFVECLPPSLFVCETSLEATL
jgi:hypothetical protein